MSFVLTIDVQGQVELQRGLSRLVASVKDLRPAFEEIAGDFRSDQKQRFGTAAGWAALKPATIRAKQRAGFPTSILVRTGALKGSLTGGGAVLELEPLQMRLGTEITYSIFHQKGTRFMPARPLIVLSAEQQRRWQSFIQKYLVAQTEKAFN